MIRIVNLTPHDVSVMSGDDAEAATFPTSGRYARIREILGDKVWIATDAGRIPLRQLTYAEQVDDLPDPSAGVLYVVSRITAAAVQHRDDLVFPQGELRDDHGQIIGCRALGTFADPTRLIGDE